MYRGNPAGKIFDNVMNRVHKNLKRTEFKKYSPLVEEYFYCTQTGLLAGDFCEHKAIGWFSKNNLPGTCVTCVKAPEPAVTDAPLAQEETSASSNAESTGSAGESATSSTAPPSETTTQTVENTQNNRTIE